MKKSYHRDMISEEVEAHLDHISFVLLQHLDGLGRLWINDENTGVTSLSYQALPSPVVKKMMWLISAHKCKYEGCSTRHLDITCCMIIAELKL